MCDRASPHSRFKTLFGQSKRKLSARSQVHVWRFTKLHWNWMVQWYHSSHFRERLGHSAYLVAFWWCFHYSVSVLLHTNWTLLGSMIMFHNVWKNGNIVYWMWRFPSGRLDCSNLLPLKYGSSTWQLTGSKNCSLYVDVHKSDTNIPTLELHNFFQLLLSLAQRADKSGHCKHCNAVGLFVCFTRHQIQLVVWPQHWLWWRCVNH